MRNSYIWLLLDRTDCNLYLLQFPQILVMWNHQENERNWKHLPVEILLLKVTVKGFCEVYLFKSWTTRELLSTCTSPWSQWELLVFVISPGQTLKCQYLLISVLYVDCPPYNWAVKNVLQHFRVCLVEAASSNRSLFIDLSKKEERQEYIYARKNIKACIVISALQLSWHTVQSTWIKTVFYDVPSHSI